MLLLTEINLDCGQQRPSRINDYCKAGKFHSSYHPDELFFDAGRTSENDAICNALVFTPLFSSASRDLDQFHALYRPIYDALYRMVYDVCFVLHS